MPSADRFVSSQEGWGQRLRNHPLAIAGGAAFCGALLSAFIVGAMMRPGTPAKPSKAEMARSIPETTGSAAQSAKSDPQPPPAKIETAKVEPAPVKPEPAAPNDSSSASKENGAKDSASEKSAAADCHEQTWPYIARPCLANEVPKRGVRVISTDRLADPVKSAVEQPPEAVINRAAPPPPPAAPKVAATPPNIEQKAEPAKPVETAKPVEAATPAAPASAPAPAPAASVASTQPATPPTVTSPAPMTATPVVATTPPATVQPAMADPASAVTAAPPKREAKKQKPRKPKSKRESVEEEVVETTGSGGRDFREYREVRESRDFRDSRGSGEVRGRIVERWTEREYSVPASTGSGQRRVIVIERGRGGGGFQGAASAPQSEGLFSSIFR